jgi:hypothetical protein
MGQGDTIDWGCQLELLFFFGRLFCPLVAGLDIDLPLRQLKLMMG